MTNDDKFSFAFIADPQIGMNSPNGLEGPNSDRSRLEFAIQYINKNPIDFVIFGGDQIDECDSREQWNTFTGCLPALKVPYYGVIGNHDEDEPGKKSIYLKKNGPQRFSFLHKGVFFLGCNASRLRGDFGKEDEKKELEYLEAQFRQIPKDCRLRFVVMHWPLFNVHPREEDTYWNMPNRETLIDLFRKNNVSCVLSGHWQQDLDACWYGISLITSVGTSNCLQYPEELSFKVITVFDEGWSAKRVSVEKI